MMASVKQSIVFCVLVASFLQSSSAQAQNCAGETFSGNRAYDACNSLAVLGASLHWTYHAANGTLDVAYRAPQSSTGWVAWAINPSGESGGNAMPGANAFLAFPDPSTAAVTIWTTQLSSYSPTVQDETLSFPVYLRQAEYSGGYYTIYATVGLPANRTTVTTLWQSSTLFQNGAPYGHPAGVNLNSKISTLDLLSGQAAAAGAGGGSRQRRKNIHGVLNTVSWGIMMPIGAIIARYLRVFPSADPAWYYLHIGCQMSAYIIGVSGWGLGLKLGSESAGIVHHKHRIIGITLFCLATLQLFALLMRPDKKNKYRICWNIYHHSVGYLIILLGAINIFKGFDILLPDNKWKHAYIAAIVLMAAIALILEVFTWTVVLRRRRRRQSENSANLPSLNGANGYGVKQNQGV